MVEGHLEVQVQSVVNCSDEVLPKRLLEMWEEHTTVMGMVRDILMYMDRT